MRIVIASFLALAAHLLPRPALAAESFDNCSGFITSLPAVITTQGVWCMDRDLASALSTGNLVTINTNNVTIDCNDYKLGGLGAGAGTTTVGVFAQNRLNATVRNCNIRGTRVGTLLTGSGHIVEDNRFEANRLVSIFVSGDNNVVSRNFVIDTGGGDGGPIGIQSAGGVDITSNTVSGVTGTTSVSGIYLSNASYSSVRGNVVRGILRGASGFQTSLEIVGGSLHVDVSDNRFFGVSNGVGEAVYCANENAATASNNVFLANFVALDGCNDGGGNVIN